MPQAYVCRQCCTSTACSPKHAVGSTARGSACQVCVCSLTLQSTQTSCLISILTMLLPACHVDSTLSSWHRASKEHAFNALWEPLPRASAHSRHSVDTSPSFSHGLPVPSPRTQNQAKSIPAVPISRQGLESSPGLSRAAATYNQLAFSKARPLSALSYRWVQFSIRNVFCFKFFCL